MPNYEARRAAMVESQLRRRGIWDERVLAAMGQVPREEFVPRRARHRAYADSALEIGGGQTISQPWVVAAICQELALEGEERVLEIGTGSGYSAAVLSLLAREVVSIELDPELARAARRELVRVGVHGVHLEVGDGSRGDPERAPFAAIAVHAACPEPPPALLAQLEEGGRMVAPIAVGGASDPEGRATGGDPAGRGEMLTVFHRHGREITTSEIAPVRFVPLRGAGDLAEG